MSHMLADMKTKRHFTSETNQAKTRQIIRKTARQLRQGHQKHPKTLQKAFKEHNNGPKNPSKNTKKNKRVFKNKRHGQLRQPFKTSHPSGSSIWTSPSGLLKSRWPPTSLRSSRLSGPQATGGLVGQFGFGLLKKKKKNTMLQKKFQSPTKQPDSIDLLVLGGTGRLEPPVVV